MRFRGFEHQEVREAAQQLTCRLEARHPGANHDNAVILFTARLICIISAHVATVASGAVTALDPVCRTMSVGHIYAGRAASRQVEAAPSPPEPAYNIRIAQRLHRATDAACEQ